MARALLVLFVTMVTGVTHALVLVVGDGDHAEVCACSGEALADAKWRPVTQR